MFVPRTCTEVVEANQTSRGEAKPLSDFESAGAYVLLGAPGAGKTTEFQEEARRAGARYVTARDFATLDDPEWQGRTLFIDALDEMRAGSADGRTPLDKIRGKLQQLGKPRFRLSCREADWFDTSDRTHLAMVSRDQKVRVLRLNPLSASQIHEMLAGHSDVASAAAFIKSAEDRGISSLLANPQSLDLLARAVSSGSWPDTRQQTFEIACRQLLREQNDEHIVGGGADASEQDMLKEAGRMCAVLLLSGHEGVSVTTAAMSPGHIPLYLVADPQQEALQAALRTRVFTSSQHRAPAHRQIAEYLAGRHLAHLIAQGLPARRIIALMTGQDGGIVSGMRGLAAWLAAHSPQSRLDLIERDPFGAVLYGDVKDFTTGEKQRLVKAIERQAERDPHSLLLRHELDARWGDLATPDVEPIFRQVLTDAGGDDVKQAVAQAVLAALCRGTSTPTLRPVLMDVVRNNDCWPVVRSNALEAYATQHDDEDCVADELQLLLNDIKVGKVLDSTDWLRGALLTRLYPRWLTPATICGHLTDPSPVTGLYTFFWTHTVVDASTDEQCRELLDALAARRDDLPSVRSLRTVPHRLLSRLLQRGTTIDSKRLYEWFRLVVGTHDGNLGALMWAWLTARPQQYKELIDIDASHAAFDSVHVAAQRIPPCKKPSDFGLWCLSRATAAAEEETARYFLWHLFSCVGRGEGADGLSHQVVEAQLGAHPALLAWSRGVLEARDDAGFLEAQAMARDEEDLQRAKAERDGVRRNKQKQWQQHLLQHKADIRAEWPPALLDNLAHAYFGFFERYETPTGNLLAFLGDEGLVELSLAALQATPSRSDLPDAADIIQLATADEHHPLALPFLAALEELSSLDMGQPPLEEKGIRLAVAIQLNTIWPPSRWYALALEKYPDLVATVLIESYRAAFQRGETRIAATVDFTHTAVAERAILPLLRMFPCQYKPDHPDQLSTLRRLMAAFNSLNSPSSDLTELVQYKLSLCAMPVVQRLHWLCFKLMFASEDDVPSTQYLLDHHSGSQNADVIVMLLNEGVVHPDRLHAHALCALIEAIGPHYSPSWSGGDGMAPTSKQGTAMMHRLFGYLSLSRPPAAASTLERLTSNKALDDWAGHLLHAAALHADARREAGYRYASTDQVVRTLAGGPPANAADLAALATDYLEGIAKRTRDGNTSDWRQYWNTPKSDPWTPKVENLCRDRLLMELQIRLENTSVQALSEATYANDSRADICLSHGDVNVPVEIKRSSHPDLWRAIEDQLIRKYTRDPRAGHGIYLVFWFGQDHCHGQRRGGKPSSAAELAERLRSTLTTEQARKITVVVIDVSVPPPN